MKFKKYHGYMPESIFMVIFLSVACWGLLILDLLDNRTGGMEKENILFVLFFALAPLWGAWNVFSYIRYMARRHGGHFMDEIEMNSEGIRLHSRKTGDMFLPWENVFEILEIRRIYTPIEIVVRGIDGEINFFGNAIARRYIKKKIGFKIQKAPGNWRERTDWRNKKGTNKM